MNGEDPSSGWHLSGHVRYVSDELIHCLGRNLGSDDERYRLLVDVLRAGQLRRPPRQGFSGFRMDMYADPCDNELIDSQVICFCDIPLPALEIHLKKYSRFGISFAKAFLVQQGANPVFYIARDSALPANVWLTSKPKPATPRVKDPYAARPEAPGSVTRCSYFGAAAALYNSEYTYRFATTPSAERQTNDFKRMADLNTFFTFQFFAFLKFFDPQLADEDPDNYYMEREWRVLGDVEFDLRDVQRVLIPKAYSDRLRSDVADIVDRITFV